MIRLLTLGNAELMKDSGEPVRGTVMQPKRFALLCYLVLREAGGFDRRNAILPLFWPDSDEARARNTLRNTLHHIRAELGADVLITRGEDEVAINPDVIGCDATEFEARIAAREWEAALDLYRGPLLPGFLPADVPAFNDWLDRRRRGIADKAALAARELTRANAGDPVIASRWAQRWAELAPHDEEAMRELVLALDEAGRRGEALVAFEAWRAGFERDVGAKPSLETMRIVELVRSRGSAAAPRAPQAAETPAAVSAVGETSRSRRPALAFAAALALVLGVSAFLMWSQPEEDRSDAYDTSVVVLPFSYGGSPDYAYLRHGIVDLLAARIGSIPGIHATDPRSVIARVNERGNTGAAIGPARGRQIARAFGARYFVLGSIVELGNALHVSAAVYDSERPARPISEQTFTDSIGGLLELTDNIGYLLVRTHLPNASGMPGSGETVRARSLPALRAYIEGETAYSAARYEEAYAAYDRAIALDSLFARAYLRKGMAAQWVGRDGDMRRAVAQAQRLAGRLSVDEQTLVRGWAAHIEGDALVAGDLYSHYLQAHPENADAWLQLGEVRFHWGSSLGFSPADAEEPFRRALALMPEAAPALTHLIRIAGRDGRPQAVDTFVAALLALGPRPQEAVEARAIQAAAHRDTAALRNLRLADPRLLNGLHGVISAAAYDPGVTAVMQSAPLTNGEPSVAIRDGMLHVIAGRYEDAMRVFEGIPETRRGWRVDLEAIVQTLPFVPLDTARARALREALPRYAPSADAEFLWNDEGIYTPRRLLLEALLSIRLGDAAQARRIAAQLKSPSTGQDREYAQQSIRIINAAIAFESEDWNRTLAVLGTPRVQPKGVYPTLLSVGNALDRYMRARSFDALGRFEDAERWYATFPDNTAYDLHYLGDVTQRRSVVLEKLGRKDEAERARRRVAMLRGKAL